MKIMASEAGKGDRPRKVDQKTYGKNYDSIFGKRCSICKARIDKNGKCLCKEKEK